MLCRICVIAVNTAVVLPYAHFLEIAPKYAVTCNGLGLEIIQIVELTFNLNEEKVFLCIVSISFSFQGVLSSFCCSFFVNQLIL